MSMVLRAVVVYVFLLVVFRIAGRRTVAQLTTFDLVLVLIISEAAQPALIGENASLTGAFLSILTLLMLDILMAVIRCRAPALEKWLDGVPLLVVKNGRPLHDLMRKSRIDREDILSSARVSRGLASIEEIEFAVLENNGEISVIPKRPFPST